MGKLTDCTLMSVRESFLCQERCLSYSWVASNGCAGVTLSAPAEHHASAQPGVPAASSARSSPSAARCAALPLPPAMCSTRNASRLLPLLEAGGAAAVVAAVTGLHPLQVRAAGAGNAVDLRPLPPASACTSRRLPLPDPFLCLPPPCCWPTNSSAASSDSTGWLGPPAMETSTQALPRLIVMVACCSLSWRALRQSTWMPCCPEKAPLSEPDHVMEAFLQH